MCKACRRTPPYYGPRAFFAGCRKCFLEKLYKHEFSLELLEAMRESATEPSPVNSRRKEIINRYGEKVLKVYEEQEAKEQRRSSKKNRKYLPAKELDS